MPADEILTLFERINSNFMKLWHDFGKKREQLKVKWTISADYNYIWIILITSSLTTLKQQPLFKTKMHYAARCFEVFLEALSPKTRQVSYRFEQVSCKFRSDQLHSVVEEFSRMTSSNWFKHGTKMQDFLQIFLYSNTSQDVYAKLQVVPPKTHLLLL